MTELLAISNHKNDLNFLLNQPLNILVDFCKLASNYIHKGCNIKLYHTVSQKLHVNLTEVQAAVESLAYLFIEAEKNKTSKDVIREAVMNLGLTENFFDALFNEFILQKNVIQMGLSFVGIQHFQFNDLKWRFETQVSSKTVTKQNQSKIIIKLELKKSNQIQSFCLASNISNIIYMSQLLNNALQDSKTNHSKKMAKAVT